MQISSPPLFGKDTRRPFSKASGLALVLMLVTSTAFGQRIDELRGEKLRISTDSLKFVNGQKWEALDAAGESTGWIEITQVKDQNAYGVIREGKAERGNNLRLRENVGITVKESEIRPRKWFVGPSLMQSEIKTTANSNDISLSGSQIGLQVGFDQVLSPRQLLRLRLGNDLISAKGTTEDSSLCHGDNRCELWTHYLAASLGFVFQAMPEGHSWNLGLTTGFAGLLPVSRQSDIVNTAKISLDGGFEAGLFASVKTNPITWLEFSAQQLFLRDTSAARYRLFRYNINWVQNF